MLRSMSGRLTFSSSAKKQKKDERERKRLEQEEAAAEEHRQAQEKLRLEQRQAALQEEQRKLQEEERKLQEAATQREVERLAEMARRSAGKICEKVPKSMRVMRPENMESLFELNAQPLGQGQMSTIFHARKRDDGEWVLLKIFNLPVLEQSQRALGKAANEAEALSLIPPHPNIVRLHAIVCAPTECALTVDSAADDLLSLLDVYGGFLPEDHTRPLMRQVFLAVAHLHSHRWAHCDLKPEHISLAAWRQRRQRYKRADGDGRHGR